MYGNRGIRVDAIRYKVIVTHFGDKYKPIHAGFRVFFRLFVCFRANLAARTV